MRKKIRALIPCCLIATFSPALSLVTSCSNDDAPLDIKVDKEKVISYEHDFVINCIANKTLPTNTSVSVIGAGSDVYVNVDETHISGSKGKISLRISSTIHYDKKIDFALRFNLGNEDFYINGLQVNYFFQEEQYKDEIVSSQESLKCEDSWHYEYKFQFSNMPQSSVQMRLVGGQSYECLKLTQTIGHVVKEGKFYYLYVPIDLSYSIVEDDFLTFNIEFSFTNSFGFTQITNINDIGCEFKFTPTDIVPVDFFKLSGSSIVGWKETVTVATIQHFSTIMIPSSIARINDGAFNLIDNNPDTYKTITTLYIAQNVDYVANKAFFNFFNLEVLDLSGCYGMPSWLTNDLYKNWKYFDSQSWNHKSGIVWVGDRFDDKHKKIDSDLKRWDWIQHLQAKGLGGITSEAYDINNWKQNWTPYSVNSLECEVTDESWFEIDNNHTLIGLNINKINKSDIRDIALIKIPDDVTKISIAPNKVGFDYFSTKPLDFDPLRCIPPVSSNYWPIGRRLFLGKGLKEITINGDGKTGAFENAGVAGNIILPDSLTTMGARAFYSATYMKPIAADAPPECGFGFENSVKPSLAFIGDYAFADSCIHYISLPETIETLGDALFKHDGRDENKRLEKIDLSAFKTIPYIDASHPLEGLQSYKDLGLARFFYIYSRELKNDWQALLKKWHNDTDLPSDWVVEIK